MERRSSMSAPGELLSVRGLPARVLAEIDHSGGGTSIRFGSLRLRWQIGQVGSSSSRPNPNTDPTGTPDPEYIPNPIPGYAKSLFLDYY